MQSGTSGASSVFVYAWGRGDLGQLGVGDDNNHNSPTLVATLANKKIVHVAAGDYHTAFLTNEGEVYTTGSNDVGQLGAKGRESQVSPVRVAALDTHTIIHIACGLAHTVAVTDTGALASWGDAEFGQLGVKEAGSLVGGMQPRIVKGSRESHFSHVAAGGYHTLALTGSGDVYSFGQGSSGALGHGDTESCVTPILVEALWGLGVVQVACGETHSSALTVDGQVFTWGRGKYGQLGHGSTQNEAFPVSVTALTDQMIVQIICGGDHTMAINGDGVLFSWGQGHWGQTGVDSKEDVLAPKQVTALEGKRVKQGSAGARHSIVLTDDGEIYGWGDNEQGQLGELASETQLSPVLLWGFEDGKRPLFVVAGGEHTVAVFDMVPGDYLISGQESYSLQEGMPMELDDDETSGKAERIGFGNGLKPLALPSLVDLVQNAKVSPRGLPHLAHALEDTFSSVKFLTLAFKRQHRNGEMRGAAGQEMDGPGLDIEMVRNIYQGILELYNPEVLQTLGEAMVRLFQGIEQNMDHVPETRWTRVLLIGLQSPLIGERGLGDLISARLFAVFVRMSLTAERKIGRWLRTYPQDIFGGRFVRGVQRYISNRGTHLLSGRGGISPDVFAAMKVLLLLFEVDKKECLIPYSEFYNNAISEHASLEEDYIRWRKGYQEKDPRIVSFCQVSFLMAAISPTVLNPFFMYQVPFILTVDAKGKVLQVEADFEKRRMVLQTSIVAQVFGNSHESPYLILAVRRSNLVQDSLHQLAEQQFYLKKPLKVVFVGEAGVDEGGVTKEFFQLLTRELFNVSYGMFIYSEEYRTFWFNHNSMESEQEFNLMGSILGLGIYNGVILDIHFPLVVYKKLMKEPLHLSDLKSLDPQLGRGLDQLLEFEGNVADTFSLNFQVTYDFFGETKTHDLIPGGGDIPVTNENRERYVNLYVKYVLVDSVEKQYDAFYRGFIQVCGGPALSLFRHEELELLVCGLHHYDFDVCQLQPMFQSFEHGRVSSLLEHALERVTSYQNGFTKDSQVIRWFWELVRAMNTEERKQLLFFTTGNDRAPVGGLATLRFIIQQNGEDTERLPTAHTCFNVLMLPDYSSKSKLENRLKLAMANSTGFGLQ